MKVDRNAPCFCGSGKKYKKCCLNISKQELFYKKYDNFGKYFKQYSTFPSPYGKFKDNYGIYRSHRKEILRNLDYVKQQLLDLEQLSDLDIQGRMAQVLKLSYLGLEYFVENLPKFSAVPPDKEETINIFEKEVLIEISEFILNQYLSLVDGNRPNYKRIRSLIQFSLEFMKEKKETQEDHYVLLSIDTNDQLANWELIKDSDAEKRIQFDFLDEVSKSYSDKSSEFPGLLESSITSLAAIENQELNLPKKSAQLLSYSGLVMLYFGVIESELKNLVIEILDYGRKESLMWRNLIEIFEQQTVFGSENFQKDLVSGMKRFNILRNKAAHGDFVSLTDYLEVKAFVTNIDFLHIVSQKRALHKSLIEFFNFNDILCDCTAGWEFIEPSEKLKLMVPIDQLIPYLNLEELDVNFAVALIYESVDIDLIKCKDLLLKGATKGHVNSQLLLGYVHLDDEPKAEYWFKQAALKGNACAMFELSCLFNYEGEGYEWLKKAAELGYEDAQSDLEIVNRERGIRR